MSEGGNSSAACIDPRTQDYSIHLDIGYSNIYFLEDYYPFGDHQLELKYMVKECYFSHKRGNPLAELIQVTGRTSILAALSTYLTVVMSLSGRTPGVAKRSEFM